MNESFVEGNISKIGSGILKKLNLYTILQVSWLIEMYYLGINSIYNIAIKIDTIHKIKIPSIVSEYNNLILGYFKDWNNFVVFIAIALLMCGFSIVFVKLIPKISEYNLLYGYSSYGITAGGWLLLIYLTYQLYLFTGIVFLLTPILVFIATEGFQKILKMIKTKLGVGIC